MTERNQRQRAVAVVVAVVVVLLLVGWAGSCSSEPTVNDELATTARTAIEMAERSQEANDAAYLAPGRMRLLVVALGAGIPVLAAAVVLYLVCRHRPDQIEVGAWLLKDQLRLEASRRRTLDGRSSELLAADPESVTQSTDDEIDRQDAPVEGS